MKKIIFAIVSTALLLCGCTSNEQSQVIVAKRNEKATHEKYAEQIAQELKATNWSYTWEYLLPKNEDILIDFYVWEPIVDHSIWVCNEKECKLLRTEHY